MLCFGRKIGEKIIIKVGDETIVVTALPSRKGTIRIGFEASRSVTVDREEVALSKQLEAAVQAAAR